MDISIALAIQHGGELAGEERKNTLMVKCHGKMGGRESGGRVPKYTGVQSP